MFANIKCGLFVEFIEFCVYVFLEDIEIVKNY